LKADEGEGAHSGNIEFRMVVPGRGASVNSNSEPQPAPAEPPKINHQTPRTRRGPKADYAGHRRSAELLANIPWKDNLRGACVVLDHPPDGGEPVIVSQKWQKDGVKTWVQAFEDLKCEPEIERAIERRVKLGIPLLSKPA
jgi:hypothetical protein